MTINGPGRSEKSVTRYRRPLAHRRQRTQRGRERKYSSTAAGERNCSLSIKPHFNSPVSAPAGDGGGKVQTLLQAAETEGH